MAWAAPWERNPYGLTAEQCYGGPSFSDKQAVFSVVFFTHLLKRNNLSFSSAPAGAGMGLLVRAVDGVPSF